MVVLPEKILIIANSKLFFLQSLGRADAAGTHLGEFEEKTEHSSPNSEKDTRCSKGKKKGSKLKG